MSRTIALAAALAAGLTLASAPALAQAGMTATQGGPHGSAPAPIAPQLQAILQALETADGQLAAARGSSERPNYEQTRRALMGAQDTLAEMRSAGGSRNNPQLFDDAAREVSEALRTLEGDSPQVVRVLEELRQARNALTALGSAAGVATGGGYANQPAAGGGQPR
jgi:hypothetical protein